MSRPFQSSRSPPKDRRFSKLYRSSHRSKNSPREMRQVRGIQRENRLHGSPIRKNDINSLDGNVILFRIDQMRHLATDGPLSYRALSFAGGGGMVITSFSDWISNIDESSSTKSLISIQTFLFGILFCILELPLCWFYRGKINKIRAHLYDQIRCLRFLLGRGIIYFFAGSLQFSQMNAVDMACGGFMMFVGLISIIVGKSTARRFHRLKMAIFEESFIKNEFHRLEKDGVITWKQFPLFIRSIGLEFGKNEFKNAFREMDWNEDQKISLEEFKRWWDYYLVEDFEKYLIV